MQGMGLKEIGCHQISGPGDQAISRVTAKLRYSRGTGLWVDTDLGLIKGRTNLGGFGKDEHPRGVSVPSGWKLEGHSDLDQRMGWYPSFTCPPIWPSLS